MKLAIVIGIADYEAPLQALPGCASDVAGMRALLDATGNYDDILYLDNETSSAHVKQMIAQFVARYDHGLSVDEVLFYFTGHGDFTGDEFYYILGDFKEAHRAATSLQNSEVDTMLRSLKPKLSVKIVDACFSGITYVKDIGAMAKHLDASKQLFQKCYFLFSSQSDQASYQSSHMSNFTMALLQAVSQHDADTIRYKDLIDHVSDAFQEDQSQRPHFVVQADFTEVFAASTEDLRQAVVTHLESSSNQESKSGPKTSLVQHVIDESQLYCSFDDIPGRLQRLHEMAEAATFSEDFSALYDVGIRLYPKTQVETGIGELVQWLEQNDGKGYLVQVDYKFVSDDLPPFVSGLVPIGDLPFVQIELTAEPKYPNLDPALIDLILMPSRLTMMCFYYFTTYTPAPDVDERGIADVTRWKTTHAQIKDDAALSNLLVMVFSEFEAYVLAPHRKRLLADDTPRDDEQDEETLSES